VGAGKAVAGDEIRLERSDGRTVPVAVHVNATWLPDGRTTGLRWILHDLRTLKDAHERLNRATSLAAVGQTVAAIAHESRTALQRAQACIRMLRLEVGDRPTALDLADRVGKAVEDMAQIVETVRAIVTRPHLRTQPCDLRTVWREAWEQAIVAGQPGILVEPAGQWDATVVGDPFRLGQALGNLFDNAIAVGATSVTVTGAATELDGRSAVRLSIRDDGPGLTTEQRRRLFEPFYSTRPDGMGLGMAIVQNVIEAHGGRVAAADRDPPGAEIVITLLRVPS
jgi:two-component system, LuxR family, sensor kinase FixL